MSPALANDLLVFDGSEPKILAAAMLNRHPNLVSYSKRHTQDTPKLSNCNITAGIDDKILSRCHGILDEASTE